MEPGNLLPFPVRVWHDRRTCCVFVFQCRLSLRLLLMSSHCCRDWSLTMAVIARTTSPQPPSGWWTRAAFSSCSGASLSSTHRAHSSNTSSSTRYSYRSPPHLAPSFISFYYFYYFIFLFLFCPFPGLRPIPVHRCWAAPPPVHVPAPIVGLHRPSPYNSPPQRFHLASLIVCGVCVRGQSGGAVSALACWTLCWRRHHQATSNGSSSPSPPKPVPPSHQLQLISSMTQC